jgi:hypothetical protein
MPKLIKGREILESDATSEDVWRQKRREIVDRIDSEGQCANVVGFEKWVLVQAVPPARF